MNMHVMIDLETLGISNDSVFLSIAAQLFVPSSTEGWEQFGHDGLFYATIDLESALKAGRTISASTLQWWMRQEPEVMREMFIDPKPLEHVLKEFAEFIRQYNVKGFWGNSASFDLGMLTDAYKKAGIPIPWHYGQEFCFRTVKNLFKSEKIKFEGAKHHPVDDARNQILQLQQVFQQIPPQLWKI